MGLGMKRATNGSTHTKLEAVMANLSLIAICAFALIGCSESDQPKPAATPPISVTPDATPPSSDGEPIATAPAAPNGQLVGAITETASGKINGAATSSGGLVFKGIPYAAAPVGELRWQPPQPVQPWSDVRSAKEFGEPCAQISGYGAEFGGQFGGSEDCLFLNVWVPAKAKVGDDLATLVWIHGGGMTAGAARADDGEALANAGNVIVVTVDYRLGMLGSLALEALQQESAKTGKYGPSGTTGNYSLLDQVAGIRWVRGNIKNFGGDPAHVTVFGQSAGAYSVFGLVASPLTKGLFKGAIVESSKAKGRTLADALTISHGAVQILGCDAADLVCLRKLPAEKIAGNQVIGGIAGGGEAYGATADGYFLTDIPTNIFAAGKNNHIPMIIGGTAFEAAAIFPTQGEVKDFVDLNIVARFGTAGYEALLANYPESPLMTKEARSLQLLSDMQMTCPHIDTIKKMMKAEDQPPVFNYTFTQIITASKDGKTKTRFPAHAAELPFVFGVDPSKTDKLDGVQVTPSIDDLSKLVNTMQGYWTSFAKSGTPGDWEPATASTLPGMQIDTTGAIDPNHGELAVCKQLKTLLATPVAKVADGAACPDRPNTMQVGGVCVPLVPVYMLVRTNAQGKTPDVVLNGNPNLPTAAGYKNAGVLFYAPEDPEKYVAFGQPTASLAPVWSTVANAGSCEKANECAVHHYIGSSNGDGATDLSASLAQVHARVAKGEQFRDWFFVLDHAVGDTVPLVECTKAGGEQTFLWPMKSGETACPQADQGFQPGKKVGYVRASGAVNAALLTQKPKN